MRVFKSLVVVGVMLGAFSGTAAQAAPIDVRSYVNTQRATLRPTNRRTYQLALLPLV